ncbi:hypothetical protein BDZ89DRAFT_1168734 [Hymenopellis radicata]|nr:hypothetical protein BDZ89DRAFT_1168734 [Hymenopellis radicata]
MPSTPQPISRDAREYLHDRFLQLEYLVEKEAITKDDIDIYRKFQTAADQDVHFIRFCRLKDRTSRGQENCLCADAKILEATHASSYRVIISDQVIDANRRGFHQGFILDLFRLAVRCDARAVHAHKSSIPTAKTWSSAGTMVVVLRLSTCGCASPVRSGTLTRSAPIGRTCGV